MRMTGLLLAGAAMLLLAGTAGATTLSGAATGLAPLNFSEFELAGCKGTGPFCPFGRHWVCPKWHGCICAACGAYKMPGGKWRSG
jgi:hypothetical protein